MINTIRESKVTKVISCYLAIQIVIQMMQPMQLMALSSGPSQPEFNSFTPIGTSDMVNLSSGDFNYNIPIMDVGGYPLNLAYDAGVTMDQEASWVGLGWNLNVGQIARQVRGLPDDFSGDKIKYENDMKPNKTYGVVFGIEAYIFGKGKDNAAGIKEFNQIGKYGGSLGIQYNNYSGISIMPSLGLSFQVTKNVSLGFNLSGSDTDGANISPTLSLSAKNSPESKRKFNLNGSVGVSYNSRQGLTSMNLSASGSTLMKKNKMRLAGGGSTSFSFVNNTYTPTKRNSYANYNGSIKVAIGTEFFGAAVQGDVEGYVNYQGIKSTEKSTLESAFGYENTEKAGTHDILDFNREKDRALSQATKVLPITNYTYDLYAIQGQGIGGQFRPFRGQIGYVYDQYISDSGGGANLGLEFAGGNLVHVGADLRVNTSSSYTGGWSRNNNALKYLVEKTEGNKPDYQNVYYKRIGEMNIDKEIGPETKLFEEDLASYKPIRIGLGGSNDNYNARNQFEAKNSTVPISIQKQLKRENRVLTGDAIQKKTVEDITVYGNKYDRSLLSEFVGTGENRKSHHIAEVNVLQKDGSRYVYGKAAYNTKKVEATFNISGRKPSCGASDLGLVTYNDGVDNSGANENGNESFNRVTTPGYGHTYLLSSVLSSDYEDLTDNGPTIDDIGAYTKFSYRNREPNGDTYKWRVPFQQNKASHNEGLKSDLTDDTASYVYGEKELVYIDTIQTKTHVARFYLSTRDDAFGVEGENGGIDTSAPLYKLDRVALFSKPEYDEKGENAEPIKVAHFEYDYTLVPGTPNSIATDKIPNTDLKKGKLTLKKVFFTYGNNDMGRYTPYTFTYDDFNPAYGLKNYDIWGNYKAGSTGCEISSPLTVNEFPYVTQDKDMHDQNVRAWTLKSIGLPSGGKLEIETEADDYQYVQNKDTMRMFKVIGVGGTDTPDASQLIQQELYDDEFYPQNKVSHLYVEIDDDIKDDPDLEQKMIDPIIEDPIYFRFLVNMRKENAFGDLQDDDPNLPDFLKSNIDKGSFDYVTGYLFLDKEGVFNTFTKGEKTYAAIPIESSTIPENNNDINPISKAGFGFGRKYLNDIVYSSVNGKGYKSDDPIAIIQKLVGSIRSMASVFVGPNEELMAKSCARRFIGGKSWIRLRNPSKNKLGGGARVKSIQMYDQWDAMTSNTSQSDVPDNAIYGQFYGQEYTYQLANNSSSGVATYEPLISKENPFVEPINENKSILLAPDEDNYVEKPLGESFFPSPAVTYSRVAVRNLSRKIFEPDGETVYQEVKKHATGQVVNEFYTTYGYPTEVDYTAIETKIKPPIKLPNGVHVEEHKEMVMSQGFVVHTNDMNGKPMSQKVYAEGAEEAISGVEYVYHKRDLTAYKKSPIEGKLDNKVTVIDENGGVTQKTIGVQFDVINDFRENGSLYMSLGADANVSTFLAGFIPGIVPFLLPRTARHTDRMRSATTTKVIHSSGILKEKIAFDLGSKVSTKNLAWDANTGDVLVTETVNEYGDQYYNLNYPAYWAYKGMGQASNNIDLEWGFEPLSDYYFKLSQDPNLSTQVDAADYLVDGDEVTVAYSILEFLDGDEEPPTFANKFKNCWVTRVDGIGKNSFKLIDINGEYLNPSDLTENEENPTKLKVRRSGYRNQQTASMASITLMRNPLKKIEKNSNGRWIEKEDFVEALPDFETSDLDQYRIVNTSAVEYSDLWATQCEVGLPKFELPEDIAYADQDDITDVICFNPYIYNVRGDWRAKRSYAYLTGRKTSTTPKLRTDGFYIDYKPLYKPLSVGVNGATWELNQEELDEKDSHWTFASMVTQYSPYGAELENKDALDRYSSAQYGYNYTLPTAVSSNSKYESMGFDGFEDYVTTDTTTDHFGFKKWEANNPGAYTTVTSHTGTASIAVAPGSKASLVTQLVPCPGGSPSASDDEVALLFSGLLVNIPVLDNDSFGPNGPSGAAISIVTEPGSGVAVVNDNNTPNDPTDDTIDYTAGIGQGIVTFQYEICDSSCTEDRKGNCDVATVSINVELETCSNSICDPISRVMVTENLIRGDRFCTSRTALIYLRGIPNTTINYQLRYVDDFAAGRGTATTVDGLEVINQNSRSYQGEVQLGENGEKDIRINIGVAQRENSGAFRNYSRVGFKVLGASSDYGEIVVDVLAWSVDCVNKGTQPNFIDYNDYSLRCPNGGGFDPTCRRD